MNAKFHTTGKHTRLGNQTKGMPVMGIDYAVQGNVVDPHVQVCPIIPTRRPCFQGPHSDGPRQEEAHANDNFHHAVMSTHMVDRQAPQERRFKPSGVCEVLNTNPHKANQKRHCLRCYFGMAILSSQITTCRIGLNFCIFINRVSLYHVGRCLMTK